MKKKSTKLKKSIKTDRKWKMKNNIGIELLDVDCRKESEKSQELLK